MNTRESLARMRINEALESESPEAVLSDVFWDSLDRDSRGFLVDHGFDADDLVAVLLPILIEHFDKADTQ